MTDLEQLNHFKTQVLSLRSQFINYVEEQQQSSKSKDKSQEDSQFISTPYTISGVVNKQRPDIQSFLELYQKFEEVMAMKNRFQTEVLQKKSFNDSKTKTETQFKIDTLKAKIALQNKALENLRLRK